MTTYKTSDILDATATQIQRYGWVQNAWYAPKGADEPPTPTDCAVCPRGGFAVAVGHHPLFGEEPWEHTLHPVIADGDYSILDDADQDALDAIEAAEKAFAGYLREVLGVADEFLTDADLVASWNDDPMRTAEQVVRHLRTAAEREREQGR